MYFAGEDVPQDIFKAKTLYRKAAEQGLGGAQYFLGNMLYADQDYVQAHMWFSLAAANRETENGKIREMAVTKRDEVAAKMTAAQIAEAEGLAREWKPK
jgi:TPR repeat protein